MADGSQFGAGQFDAKMNDLLQVVEQELSPYYDSFATMDLQDNLLRGIYAYGFEKPIGIQQIGFGRFCEGGNIIQEAPSGTERTAMFCCGILQQLDYGLIKCQALVLTPTRECAQQIEKVMRALGDYLPLRVHACAADGTSTVVEDQRILSAGVHVVVGTPNRVFELLRRQSLRADYIRMFVLDEADELLLQGSKDQTYDIFQLLPPKVQVGMFFATMPPESSEVGMKFMNRFTIIKANRDELLPEGIKQFYVNVEKEEWKFELLCDLYEITAVTQSIIFVNTRREIDWLADKLRSLDHTVSVFYKDMDHETRDINIREFSSGLSRVLITTDFLARCIDVQLASLVINYDLPTRPENYLHRIGIFGRSGKKGFFINFMTSNDDEKMLQDIQNVYGVVFEELPCDFADLL